MIASALALEARMRGPLEIGNRASGTVGLAEWRHVKLAAIEAPVLPI